MPAGAGRPAPPAFLVTTGLSGSGKSQVHRCFEDMGFFCVDNLPIELIPKFAEMRERGGQGFDRVALTVDVREREGLQTFPQVLAELRLRHPDVRLLFLEADDATLVRRFSETRRPHPLSATGLDLLAGIASERQLLAPLRAVADVILDTTEFTPHELKRYLWSRFGEAGAEQRLQVAVVSFAYRHGIPRQADLVLDVRFLPNPHFDEKLRPLSGLDEPVQSYLAAREEYREFMRKLEDLLGFLLPHYQREGKSYLTLAVGCTGGRHRSVAVAEALGPLLESRGIRAARSHRDIERQGGA